MRRLRPLYLLTHLFSEWVMATFKLVITKLIDPVTEEQKKVSTTMEEWQRRRAGDTYKRP
jgi:hypothetical protein